jgi:hypothetical protein
MYFCFEGMNMLLPEVQRIKSPKIATVLAWKLMATNEK